MMAREENNKQKRATFTWILENVSCCWQKNDERILSPAFSVDSIENTKWRLILYLRGSKYSSDIGVYLQRELDSDGPSTIEVDKELAILAVDGSPLMSRVTKSSYEKGMSLGYPHFVKREDAFIMKRSIFLPEDTLTIRCKMWQCGNVETSEVFVARTRIKVERRSFLWEIDCFSSREPYEKETYLLKSAEKDKTLMSFHILLTGGQSCEEVVRLEFTALDQMIKFSSLKVFLLDASGDAVECFQDEIWFDVVKITSQVLFPTKKLIAEKDLFLPNDVLSLHFESTFTTGVLVDEVEEIGYERTVGKNSSLETKLPASTCLDGKEKSLSACALKDNLKSLFTDRIFCDTELRTRTGTFPAHKSILSARSPVFQALFSTDMKEKAKDYAVIEDLKEDTVRRMLLYMYTAVVEDLQWKSASQLYVAADKYQILTLRMKCSEFLKSNICPANACEILVLADMHHDNDLKSYVQGFILSNEDTMNSIEWKSLMETNVKLAANTMYLKFKK